MDVNITKRIDTRDGRRFSKVIFTPNGRIKPDWVEVDERQEKHPEGAYYLDWTEDGQRKRMAVGSDATAAYNSLKKKQSEFDAIARGLVVTDPVKEENTRLRLSAAKADFLEDIQLSRQRKTWLGYCLSLSYFVECCSKTYVEDIERKDLLRFVVFLRDEKELAPRTVHNKFAELLTFLAGQGVPKLISKNDRPRFVDQEVEIYEARTHIERLQCYRGVTEDKAIGRFDEGLQRLYMEFSKGQREDWQSVQTNLKGRDFFRPGPLMRALECDRPCVLLIDELDKVDDGFEAMLLEILSAWQLSIPEFGTVSAKSIPFVVLTSNEERRLGDPIRRRSLYVRVEHPTPEREAEIIASRTPKADESFHREMAGIALSFRNYSLEKPPSVSEMIDFANALQLLGTDHVTAELRDVLLPFLAKTDDILYLLAMELRAMRKRIGFVLSDAFRRSLLETRTLTNSNNSEVVVLRDFLSGNQI